MVLYSSEQTPKTFIFIDLVGHGIAWLQYTLGQGQCTSMAHQKKKKILLSSDIKCKKEVFFSLIQRLYPV